jgi:hypothetical protein
MPLPYRIAAWNGLRSSQLPHFVGRRRSLSWSVLLTFTAMSAMISRNQVHLLAKKPTSTILRTAPALEMNVSREETVRDSWSLPVGITNARDDAETNETEQIFDSNSSLVADIQGENVSTAAFPLLVDSVIQPAVGNIIEQSIRHVEPLSNITAAVCFKTLFGDIDLGLVIQWAGTCMREQTFLARAGTLSSPGPRAHSLWAIQF